MLSVDGLVDGLVADGLVVDESSGGLSDGKVWAAGSVGNVAGSVAKETVAMGSETIAALSNPEVSNPEVSNPENVKPFILSYAESQCQLSRESCAVDNCRFSKSTG